MKEGARSKISEVVRMIPNEDLAAVQGKHCPIMYGLHAVARLHFAHLKEDDVDDDGLVESSEMMLVGEGIGLEEG